MGYYIRVLATDATPVPLDDLITCLPSAPAVELTVEAGDRAAWSQLLLRHTSGKEIAAIEKNDVIAGELGADEIAEFIDEISDAQPQSAARWLGQYLMRIRTIYAFQILGGTETDNGWSAVQALHRYIREQRGGISQADGEGFSNENGDHILWQFSNDVEGDWDVAILDSQGNWIPFTMDLASMEHRSAFLDGRVPAGVKR